MTIRKIENGYTDGKDTVTIRPNGGRRGTGWGIYLSWKADFDGWVDRKPEAMAHARDLLVERQRHVAAIRHRIETTATNVGVWVSPDLIEALTKEFSK